MVVTEVRTFEIHLPSPRNPQWAVADMELRIALLNLFGGYNSHRADGKWVNKEDGAVHTDSISIVRADYAMPSAAHIRRPDVWDIARMLQGNLRRYMTISGELCLYIKFGNEQMLFHAGDIVL